MSTRFVLTKGDRLRLRAKLLSMLQHGKQNAIRGSELARLLGENDDRKIRLMIEELITEGIPIASSVSEPMGFFIIKNGDEASEYIRTLRNRIRENEKRLEAFERATAQYNPPSQPALGLPV